VLQRPHDEPAGPSTVAPGEHTFADAGYSIVWWDPTALALGARAPFGVRREELIVKDVPRHVVADGRGRYDRWKLARFDARATGTQLSITVKPVRQWTTEAGEGPQALPVDFESIRVSRLAREDQARPYGAAFGNLVHAVLAQVPFDASARTIAGLAEIEARLLGLETADASAAAALVTRVIAHEIVTRAREAHARGRCRRETPITYVLDDGTMLEGTVDLAFEHDAGWTVVDYKTDREIAAAGIDQYRRQVAVYASAIAQATGARCDGVVLVI
jgi:ATP-dependent exoDNAse (exonuclease V) beta subunit